MFNSGPVVNNVLACMTDKIVCATFSADPSVVVEDDEDVKDSESVSSTSTSSSVRLAKQSNNRATAAAAAATTTAVQNQPESPSSTVPVSSLALAAAPLLTSNFAFDSRGVTVLRNFSAPNSRRTSSAEQTDISAQLSLVGDHTNIGALHLFHVDPSNMPTSISVHSLCQLSTEQANSVQLANHQTDKRRKQSEPSTTPTDQNQSSRYPLSPKLKNKVTDDVLTGSRSPLDEADLPVSSSAQDYEVDSSVRSAQITPDSTPGRSLSSSRSRINTDDRERFTEEVTV